MQQTGCYTQAWTAIRGHNTSIRWNVASALRHHTAALQHRWREEEGDDFFFSFFPCLTLSPPHDFIHLIQKNHLCSILVHLPLFAALVFYYLELSVSPSSFISLTGISFSLFLWGFSLSLKVISSTPRSNSVRPEMLIFRLKAQML